MEDIKIRIVEEQKGQRIDKILAKELADFSRTQIQSLIQNGYVVIDEKPINCLLYTSKRK